MSKTRELFRARRLLFLLLLAATCLPFRIAAQVATESKAIATPKIIEGEVFDSLSGMPVVRAQIVLNYTVPRPNTQRGSRCVRSSGTQTDEHGKFHLKVEYETDDVPTNVFAVAPGYFAAVKDVRGTIRFSLKERGDPKDTAKNIERRPELDAERYLISDSQLDCWHAKSRDDAAAAISALQILKDAYTMYGVSDGRSLFSIRPLEVSRQIYLLQSLPPKNNGVRQTN